MQYMDMYISESGSPVLKYTYIKEWTVRCTVPPPLHNTASFQCMYIPEEEVWAVRHTSDVITRKRRGVQVYGKFAW